MLSKIFMFVFILEACIKIIAMGLILGQGTYLKDIWNILDFLVVLAGILELTVGQSSGMADFSNFRILRPLKAMKRLPSLRKQCGALFLAIRGLLSVVTFILFMVITFSILGFNLFSGTINYSCRTTATPGLDAVTWPKHPNDI